MTTMPPRGWWPRRMRRVAVLLAWAEGDGAARSPTLAIASPPVARRRGRVLRGPTGERNVYSIVPREAVLCLADDEADLLVQLAAILAVGCRAVWPDGARACTAPAAPVRERIKLVDDWADAAVRIDAAIHHGPRIRCWPPAPGSRPGRDRSSVSTVSSRATPASRSSAWSSSALSASTPPRPAATRA